MTATTTLETLLAAILAEPAEDVHRLVFADALDEAEGRATERAEFVRVQIELARTPRFDFQCDVCGATPDDEGGVEHGRGCYTQSEDGGGSEAVEENPRYVELRRRERELLQANWERWADGGDVKLSINDKPQNLHWSRGFIESVTCTAEDWLTHADAIVAAHPMTAVHFTTSPAMTGRLNEFALWRKLERGAPWRSHRWEGITFTMPPAEQP